MPDAVVVGIQRLDDRLARELAAAGAAGDLRQQLERPLGRAEVGQAEPDVGRDHADQRHAREVVPLGDHLRADQDVDLAGGEPRQQRGDRAAPPDRVAIDARDARVGKQRAISASTRSVPKPICSRYGPAHFAQAFGSAHRVVAVVAARALRRAVHGQRHAAVRALERRRRTAGRTPRWRSRAGSAARSPARRRRAASRSRVAQRRAEDRRPGPAAAYSSRMSTIRTLASGRSSTRLLERDQRVAAALRVVVALQRRRRRAEHDQRARLARAHDRDVAAVVARALLLLVRAVVLLVDDDQAERAQRREHRRPRADDDVDVAAADALPLVVALAVGEAAVLDGDALAERAAERGGNGGRQRDLRHQQQHAASLTPRPRRASRR